MTNEENKQVADLIVERNHLQAEVRALRAELANCYLVASAARELVDECEEYDEACPGTGPLVLGHVEDLKRVITRIANATAAGKLEYLPPHLRGAS